jgi:hypothetical protein
VCCFGNEVIWKFGEGVVGLFRFGLRGVSQVRGESWRAYLVGMLFDMIVGGFVVWCLVFEGY